MRNALKFFIEMIQRRSAATEANSLTADTGSALVEMALSSSVLFAMFFGMFQISMASYAYHYVSDAAREGSRYAIVRGSTSCANEATLSGCGASASTIAAYVKGLGYPGIDSANMTVTTTYYSPSTTQPTTWTLCTSAPCNTSGSLVKVVVMYAYPFAVPFVPTRTLNVSSTSQMVVAQ